MIRTRHACLDGGDNSGGAILLLGSLLHNRSLHGLHYGLRGGVKLLGGNGRVGHDDTLLMRLFAAAASVNTTQNASYNTSNDEEAADAEANVKFSFDRNDQGHETN